MNPGAEVATVATAEGTGARCAPEADKREFLAAMANTVSLTSRRPCGPLITGASTRDEVLRWMWWNDPNGAYSPIVSHRNGPAWDESRGWYAYDDASGDTRGPFATEAEARAAAESLTMSEAETWSLLETILSDV